MLDPSAPRDADEPSTTTNAEPTTDVPVVLFDGVCNLCNGAVQFVIDHERAPILRFAPLQSDIARRLLARAFGEEEADRLRGGASGNGAPDSVVFVEGSRGSTRSTAALRIARYLRAPWSWLVLLFVIPRFVRDVGYRLIASNRYRWFGQEETCRVPSAALRARFLG